MTETFINFNVFFDFAAKRGNYMWEVTVSLKFKFMCCEHHKKQSKLYSVYFSRWYVIFESFSLSESLFVLRLCREILASKMWSSDTDGGGGWGLGWWNDELVKLSWWICKRAGGDGEVQNSSMNELKAEREFYLKRQQQPNRLNRVGVSLLLDRCDRLMCQLTSLDNDVSVREMIKYWDWKGWTFTRTWFSCSLATFFFIPVVLS